MQGSPTKLRTFCCDVLVVPVNPHPFLRSCFLFLELFQDISYSVNGFSFVFPTAVMLRKLLPAIRRTGSRTGVEDGQLHTCSGNGTGGGRWMPKKCHQLPPDESCECVHVEHVEAGHRVELVLINEGEFFILR